MRGVYFVLTDEAGGLRVVRSPGAEASVEEEWRIASDQADACKTKREMRKKGQHQPKKEKVNEEKTANDVGNCRSDHSLLCGAQAPTLQERRSLSCAGWKLMASTIEETIVLIERIEKCCVGGGNGTRNGKARGKPGRGKNSRDRGKGRMEIVRHQCATLASALRASVREAKALQAKRDDLCRKVRGRGCSCRQSFYCAASRERALTYPVVGSRALVPCSGADPNDASLCHVGLGALASRA